MVNTAFVLLPLYIYPLNNSWDIYTTSIAAHSNLEFQIIVAPDLTTVPLDPNYVSALSTLNSFSNVKTLGYVPITYAERNISDIMSDIDSYASWANYADDIGVSGIFFDQAPSTLTTHTQAYVQAITCYARGSLGSQSTQICLNPGEPVDSFFYTMADSINVYEDAWDTFNLSMMGILNWDLLARYGLSPFASPSIYWV